MKRNIIAFCIFCLCTGSLAACNDFDNPAIPDDEAPEVTPAPVPPAIDPSWNLVQMPDEGGQNPRVFVYKDKKYDALFTRTLGWNGGDGVLTTALPDGNVSYDFTAPMWIFALFGIVAVALAFMLKAEDRRKGYGLEEANIRK